MNELQMLGAALSAKQAKTKPAGIWPSGSFPTPAH